MQQLFKCYRCGAQNYVGTQSCWNCGASFTWQTMQSPLDYQQPPVYQQIYSCPNCNYQVIYGESSCRKCGTTFNWSPPQQVIPQYQQQQQIYGSYSEEKHNGESERYEEHHPSKDTLMLCNLIKLGKLDQYLNSLKKQNKKDVIEKFLDIIYTKDSFIPILFQEETPPETIGGIQVDSLKNRLSRRMTKTALLLIVASESKNLGIWNQLQEQWTGKYTLGIRGQVNVMEAIVKQLDDNGQREDAVKVRKAIAGIKDANKDLIQW